MLYSAKTTNYGDEDDGSSLRDLYVRNSELSIKAQTTFRF